MAKTKFGRTMQKHGPKILKISGFIGLIGSHVLTVYSTVKAVRACDKRKEELQVEKLPAKEILKTSWKHYILPVSVVGASAASMASGETMSGKRTALISAACAAAEQTLADYKEETIKQIGEKKEKEIEYKTLEKQSERVRNSEDFMIQGQESGGTLFYEPVTGTFFYSTRNKVDKAFNDLSAKMLRENYVDLGDLFDLLELRRVDACNMAGWNCMRTKTIEPDYRWFGIEETCTPYTIMGYNFYPTTNYIEDFR